MSTIKRVFIFAHCDDEVFCLPLLLDKGSENTIIYLTTTDKNETKIPKHDVRQREALKANEILRKYVKIETLFYKDAIYDGTIHDDFGKSNFRELTKIVLDRKPDELITLAYEGGHQDHDSTYLITLLISENHQLRLRCFSGYRASNILPRFFSVLKPISTYDKIAYKRSLVISTSIRLMMIYKSQIKTWIGLAPFILFKYSLFSFRESTYKNSLETLHLRKCLYEIRGRAKHLEILNSHQRFISHFRDISG